MKKEKPIIRYFSNVTLKWTASIWDNENQCYNFSSIKKEGVIIRTDSSKKSFLYYDYVNKTSWVRRMNKSTKIIGGVEVTREEATNEIDTWLKCFDI